MAKLNEIVKAGKKRKIIGRGGSRGGSSGRGHKGQNARSGGGVRVLFEGGQMPLFRRLPKRGFSNERFATSYEVVNIGDLERVFEAGTEVTKELLVAHGLIRGQRGSLVKILGNGELHKSLHVHADACSASAVAAIERSKGKVSVAIKE